MKTSSAYLTLVSFVSLTALTSCSDATQFSGSLGPSKADAKAVTSPEPDPLTYSGQEDPTANPGSVEEKPPLTARSTTTTGVRRGNTQGLSPEELARIVSQCQSTPNKTVIQTITFPENKNCSWNQSGNLGRKDRYLQAVEIQSATIELPQQSQLCGLEVASAATTLHYDDFLLLTINDSILLSSNQQIINGLGTSGTGTYEWDFARIRGIAVNFGSPAYCAGASSCQVPVTDVPGKFQFAIDPTRLEAIAEKVVGLHQFDFALIATGDNDDRDCYHTEFSLQFKLQYIETDAP